MKGRRWTREETTVVLSLYYQIPFGKINQTNSVICKIAKILSRTPASLAMKLGNFARFAKTLQKRNISGLKNGSKLDGDIFKEFENKLF